MPLRWSRWALLALLPLVVACQAWGAVITWTSGSTTTDNWSDGANWGGGIPPGAADTALFDQTATGSAGGFAGINGNNVVDITFAPIQKLTYGAVGAILTDHYTTINPGITLRVDGDGTGGSNGGLNLADFNVGNDITSYSGTKTVTVTFNGAGTLQIGAAGANTADIAIGHRSSAAAGGGGVAASVNMAALATFIANVDEFAVGFSGYDGPVNATVLLAASNTVNANTINIADSYNNGGNTSTVRLGQTNAINADTLYIGHRKSAGNLNFNTGLANPTVTIRDLSGIGRADLLIGDNDADTGTTPTSILDTTLGTVDALLDTVIIGRHNRGAGYSIGEFRMTLGTVSANSVLLADPSSGGTSTTPYNTQGIITMTSPTVGGGTFTVLGDVTDGGGMSTLNIYGGTMVIAGSATADNIRVGQNGLTGSLTINGTTVTSGEATRRSEIYVGRRTAETAAHSLGTLDLRNVDSFTAYLNTLGLGIGPGSATAQGQAGGEMWLADLNYINSTAITLAHSVSVGLGAQHSKLHLGADNTILTDTFTIGGSKGQGTVDFTAPGSVLNLGTSGQRADVFVANQTVGTGGGSTGTLDLRNGAFNAWIDEWVVASKPNDATGTTTGTVWMSDGVVNANSIVLARRTQAGTGGTINGIFNFLGGYITSGTITKSPVNVNKAGETVAFNWSGGKLNVGTFGNAAQAFNLLNTGTGILSPAGPGVVGTTTVYGNYVQGASAEFEVDIMGLLAGQYDVLNVLGVGTVDGLLNLHFAGGYTPMVGDYFDVMFATGGITNLGVDPYSNVGLFEARVVPGPSGGEILRVTFVPEPATLALLGLGALALVRRRRPHAR